MDLNKGYTQDIIEACKNAGLPRDQAAYVLATAWHETAHTMEPVREAYWLSETWRKSNLRYYPYYGRGFVQITWQANYKKASRKLGKDFVSDPDAVMEPRASAEILVTGMKEGWFTGKKLSDYVVDDAFLYVGARRIVNGTDKANKIAGHAIDYFHDLEGYSIKPSPFSAILEIIKVIFGGRK